MYTFTDNITQCFDDRWLNTIRDSLFVGSWERRESASLSWSVKGPAYWSYLAGGHRGTTCIKLPTCLSCDTLPPIARYEWTLYIYRLKISIIPSGINPHLSCKRQLEESLILRLDLCCLVPNLRAMLSGLWAFSRKINNLPSTVFLHCSAIC